MANQFVTYRYFRDPTGYRTPVVCAMVEVNREKGTATLSYSFCTPKERQFAKKTARDYAATKRGMGLVVEVPLIQELPKIGKLRLSDAITLTALFTGFEQFRDLSNALNPVRGDKNRVVEWADAFMHYLQLMTGVYTLVRPEDSDMAECCSVTDCDGCSCDCHSVPQPKHFDTEVDE